MTTTAMKSKNTRGWIRGMGPMVFAAMVTFANGAAMAADAAKGKIAYERNGCWQCHGTVGQGAATGPKLAPDTKALAFMQVFIRNTKGAMPPYMQAILSDADLADIHAYLESIPKSPDYKSIPLLNQ
jgi:ubiquinol-cytochrome c reductase cytochrome c subunit